MDMRNLIPMFATDSMDLGTGLTIYVFLLAAIYLAGIASAFANLFLIVSLNVSRRFAQVNIGIFSIYAVLTMAWAAGAFSLFLYSWLDMIPIILVPILPVSHLVYLLCVRRRLKADENKVTHQNMKKPVSDGGNNG
jgi:hypothetical protein